MKILGIDLGERRVGVAVWDDPDLPARPLGALELRGDDVVERVASMAAREGADELVVGLPLRLDGREGLASRKARRVARELAARTGLPVGLQDERLTTAQAHVHRVMAGHKGRDGVDARAATILLQAFVDSRRVRSGGGDPDES